MTYQLENINVPEYEFLKTKKQQLKRKPSVKITKNISKKTF